MKKVLVLFGGVSSEHSVSLISAASVAANIPSDKYEVLLMGITMDGRWLLYSGNPADLPGGKWLENHKNCIPAFISPDSAVSGIVCMKDGKAETIKIDAVFPVLHGKNGEDGTMQGLLELSGIPYVGCDTLSSAMSMDKAVTNTMADYAGIAQAKWLSLSLCEYKSSAAEIHKRAVRELGFPIFVKPANAGSSVGITKATCENSLALAIKTAFEHDKKVVLEEEIRGKEVECAVLGNEEPLTSVVGEIVPSNDFYDFDAKYISNSSELLIPARLSKSQAEKVRAAALKVYRTLGCSGLSRVDFFVRNSDAQVLFNEINTIPGFTSISMYPKMFEASGIKYPELLDKLFDLAIRRKNG